MAHDMAAATVKLSPHATGTLDDQQHRDVLDSDSEGGGQEQGMRASTLRLDPISIATTNETLHQKLQRTLAERESGGPREQVGSPGVRLRNTRCCDIVHSTLSEPLSPYKTLETCKPRWTNTRFRYHLNRGISVMDQDTIVVSARDQLQKTTHGLLRSSSGTLTYSSTHRLKAELDVAELAHILAGNVPGGGHAWTPKRLEWIFKERTGRQGCWKHYEVPFEAFLAAFPRTFESFGPVDKFVRLRHGSSVQDNCEDAMVRLARARTHGCVESKTQTLGMRNSLSESSMSKSLLFANKLKNHRLKVAYSSYLGSASPSQMVGPKPV